MREFYSKLAEDFDEMAEQTERIEQIEARPKPLR